MATKLHLLFRKKYLIPIFGLLFFDSHVLKWFGQSCSRPRNIFCYFLTASSDCAGQRSREPSWEDGWPWKVGLHGIRSFVNVIHRLILSAATQLHPNLQLKLVFVFLYSYCTKYFVTELFLKAQEFEPGLLVICSKSWRFKISELK